MDNNLLLHEVSLLQEEYREILIKASTDIFSINVNAVIDEIIVFWSRNKKLVKCILNYLIKPFSSYVFTAATILDIDDNEHFPFITFGSYNFWDDPIYRYTEISKNIHSTDWGKKLQEQVLKTINDNIKIIEKTNGHIYILPIRLLAEKETIELTHKAASQAFLSLFKENITIEEYFNKYKTIQDIKIGLKPNIEKNIILSEDDDNTLDLELRFSQCIDLKDMPLQKNASDADMFWFQLYGHLVQAFDIMIMCVEYKLIPYIRYNVALKYLLILSGNFEKSMKISEILFKSSVAYIVHHTFDKERIDGIDFINYYNFIKLYGFESKLYNKLVDNGITFEAPSFIKTETIVLEQLNEIYDVLQQSE